MTELHQLLKAPLLIEHYFEHQSKDEQLDLITFLEIHYLNGDQIDADYEKDMKLPFKSFQDNHPSVVVTIPQDPYNLNFAPVIEYPKQPYIQKSQVLYSNYFSSIWQPPKIA